MEEVPIPLEDAPKLSGHRKNDPLSTKPLISIPVSSIYQLANQWQKQKISIYLRIRLVGGGKPYCLPYGNPRRA